MSELREHAVKMEAETNDSVSDISETRRTLGIENGGSELSASHIGSITLQESERLGQQELPPWRVSGVPAVTQLYMTFAGK